jgi:hypothetical protein
MNRPGKSRHRRASPVARRSQALKNKAKRAKGSEKQMESNLDESLRETFPASDAPSRTVLTKIGSPR